MGSKKNRKRTTLLSDLVTALGQDRFDELDEQMAEQTFVTTMLAYDIESLVAFATAVRKFFEEGYDPEDSTFDVLTEMVYNAAGEALLAAQGEEWGGDTLEALYDYFDLNE